MEQFLLTYLFPQNTVLISEPTLLLLIDRIDSMLQNEQHSLWAFKCSKNADVALAEFVLDTHALEEILFLDMIQYVFTVAEVWGKVKLLQSLSWNWSPNW